MNKAAKLAVFLPSPAASRTWIAASVVALAAIAASAGPVQAGLFRPAMGRWCALTSIGLNDCSYATYEQCMATLSGIGGVCSVNLQAPPDDPPPRRKRRKPRPYG